jgi:hypothetical protein
MALTTELQVNRSAIGTTRIVASEPAPLASDTIRLSIDHVGLTANNVTYAQFGDMLDYWNFFPVDAEWGRVPAMGWATVAESNVAGIDVGGRYYGWFPMASRVDIAAAPTRSGFRDDGPHRSNHAGAYRAFTRTDLDGLYTGADDEHRHELLRGLFITGFLIDRFFAPSSYLGARQALVLSASSKTALGYASCAKGTGVRVVGLTSAANRSFVESVGLYDEVTTYDALHEIEVAPSVVIDMAGAGSVVAELHSRLGDRIAHSMVVGKSHHDAPSAAVTAGPQPQLFFAPTAMDSSVEEWGADEYARRTLDGLRSFIESSRTWLSIEEHHGSEAFASAWSTLISGSVSPSTGLIASMQPR